MAFGSNTWQEGGLRGAAFLWMLLLLVLIVGADLKAPQALVGNDYHTAFYVAGWMAGHGQLDLLYPPPGATTFHGAPFDLIVHKMLPSIDSHLVGQFMYSPLVAFIFLPLANLPPAIGQLIWQSINFVMLIASCFFIAFLNRAEKTKSSSAIISQAVAILSFSFCFLPVFNTLWLGQMDIIFGLLPITLGAWLLTRDKAMLAGLAFSTVSLKPQFLPAIALICLGLLLRKQWKVLVGLCLGLGVLIWLSYDTAGATNISNWLSTLRISEALFTGEFRNPDYLAGSLPLSFLVAFPPQERLKWKLLAYVISFIMLMVNVGLVIFLSRRKVESSDWLRFLLIVSILPIFIYSPRLLTYDWCFLLLPVALAIKLSRHDRPAFFAVLGLIACINIEIILQFSATAIVCPIALTLICTVLTAFILWRLLFPKTELIVSMRL